MLDLNEMKENITCELNALKELGVKVPKKAFTLAQNEEWLSEFNDGSMSYSELTDHCIDSSRFY